MTWLLIIGAGLFVFVVLVVAVNRPGDDGRHKRVEDDT